MQLKIFQGFTREQREFAEKHGLPLARVTVDARHLGKGGIEGSGCVPLSQLENAVKLWDQLAAMQKILAEEMLNAAVQKPEVSG